MLVVGLTGGVASGKSTVSRILEREGAVVIDADQIARELVRPGSPAFGEVVRAFGRGIVQEDGTLDRKALAARVFSDRERRTVLNRILHPRIEKEIGRRIREVAQRNPTAIVVIEAALLVEAGSPREIERLIVVTARADQQIRRLKERNGMVAEEAEKILASQMPQEERVKAADFILENEGSLEETARRTKDVFQKLKRIALEKESAVPTHPLKKEDTGEGYEHQGPKEEKD